MPAANAPFRLFGRAPLLLAVVVCLLALPALVGLVHSNAQAIREGENRNMAPPPPPALWRDNAPEYIKAWDARLRDMVGFRRQANTWYLKLRYYVFHDRPMSRITLGSGGHVFLNAPPQAPAYGRFNALCVQAGNPPPELVRKLDAVMSSATRYCKRHGARAVFAVAPSSLALYADKLPPGVPPALRRACLAYPERDHLMARLERQGETSGQYRVFYPYALFNAHKHEAHFWPRELFHWEGRSAYLFTRRLFLESGLLETVGLDDPAELAPVKDDLAVFFGFSRPVQAWHYPYADQPLRRTPVPWVREFGRPELLRHFAVTSGLTDKTALLIANSFGDALRPHLARGFAHLYALSTNYLPENRQAAVFAEVIRRVRPDYVFFVYDDANVVNLHLPRWLHAFVELEHQADQGGDGSLEAPEAAKGSSREKSGL